jgi:glyoxylate reductase
MTKPVLLVTQRLTQAVEARAEREFDARLATGDAPVGGEALVRLAQGADAILCCSIDWLDGETIRALPDSVKAIATFSAGFEHIDVAAARARGLPVCTTPDVLSVATAETAMLLILAAARRAGEGERLVRSGQWQGWRPLQMLGAQVSGRRLGILGMGSIGRALARMARGFAMEIHYRNRNRLAPELGEGAIFHADDASFLGACDVLSLNAPGGPATYHWLDARRIAMLPRGAIVVNTARGTLVDDAALLAGLHSGQVGYAGLDVYENEPRIDPGYLTAPNTVLLPHAGSSTFEARDAMGNLALDSIAAILAGRQPDNVVN